jgi:hypothetical protein
MFMIHFYIHFTLASSINSASLIFSISLPFSCPYFSSATILRVEGGVRKVFLEEVTFSQSSEYLARLAKYQGRGQEGE